MGKKVLKIVGIIIIILLIAFIIYFIRNLIIINKLSTTLSSNNYSYVVNMDSGSYEYYHKDEKSVGIWKIENTTSNMTYYNENTKEIISVYPDSLKAEISILNDDTKLPTLNVIVSTLVSGNSLNKLNTALTYFITTEEVNGEEYYVLKPLIGVTSNTYYFDKESGKQVKYTINDGEESYELTNWTFDELTEEDVTPPDLTEYNVTDYR